MINANETMLQNYREMLIALMKTDPEKITVKSFSCEYNDLLKKTIHTIRFKIDGSNDEHTIFIYRPD